MKKLLLFSLCLLAAPLFAASPSFQESTNIANAAASNAVSAAPVVQLVSTNVNGGVSFSTVATSGNTNYVAAKVNPTNNWQGTFTGDGGGLTNNTAMSALGPDSMPGSNTVAQMIATLSTGTGVTQAALDASNFVSQTTLSGSNFVNQTALSSSNYTTQAGIAGSNFVKQAGLNSSNYLSFNLANGTNLPITAIAGGMPSGAAAGMVLTLTNATTGQGTWSNAPSGGSTANVLYTNVTSGTVSAAVGLTNAANSFAGTFTGYGSGLTGVQAANGVTAQDSNILSAAVTNGGPATLGAVTATSFSGNGNAVSNINGGQLVGTVLNTTNGNVGIGTTGPAQKLTVSSIGGSKILLTGGSSQNGITFDAVGGSDSYYLFGGNGNGLAFYDSTAVITPLQILNNGNVGINKGSPGEKLEVNGSILLPSDTSVGGLKLGTFGNEISRRASDGAMMITGGQENIVITPNVNTIFTTGNVGIGTTTPGAKLDVNGNVNITGNTTNSGTVTASGFAGTNGVAVIGPDGSVTSTNFTGDGSGLTNLNSFATNIFSGTQLNFQPARQFVVTTTNLSLISLGGTDPKGGSKVELVIIPSGTNIVVTNNASWLSSDGQTSRLIYTNQTMTLIVECAAGFYTNAFWILCQ